MIMRSNKQITTLAPTWLVMGVLIAGMMRTPAFAQTSQVDNPIGRYAGYPILSAFFAEKVGFNSPSSARFGQ
jgi:hypothetical protein